MASRPSTDTGVVVGRSTTMMDKTMIGMVVIEPHQQFQCAHFHLQYILFCRNLFISVLIIISSFFISM